MFHCCHLIFEGCGMLWVADGLWKIMFSHCAMSTKVTIINNFYYLHVYKQFLHNIF